MEIEPLLSEKAAKAAYMKGYFAVRRYADRGIMAPVPKPPFRTPRWLDVTLMSVIVFLAGTNVGVAAVDFVTRW